MTEEAITAANLLLDGSGQRLVPAWRASSDGASATPVYLIESSRSALSTPAAVPRGCSCIFVHPRVFETWVAAHSRGKGRLPLQPAPLLTFMLLHEVGHLVRGASAVSFSNGEMSQLNVEPSLAKASEEAADEFATEVVRRQVMATPPVTAMVQAISVALELTKLGWNMQAYRSLDEFGAEATGKPSVYFDATYSHPNLAWRVLRSNHLIQPTPATRQLLDAFDAARERGAEAKPLFQRAEP